MEDRITEVEDDYKNVDPKIEQETEEAEEEVKEGESTKYFLITVAVILITLAAIIGIKYVIKPGGKLEKVTYNNFIFIKQGPLWHTQWKDAEGQVFNVPLHFNPYEIENVTITGALSPNFDYKEIYLTHDPAEYGLEYVSITAGELAMNMATALKMNVIAACSKNETEACLDRPIKNCESNSSVIYLKHEGPTQIMLNSTCITIQGEGMELMKAADKLLYIWYGMLKPQ